MDWAGLGEEVNHHHGEEELGVPGDEAEGLLEDLLVMLLQNHIDRGSQAYREEWNRFRTFLLQYERMNDGSAEAFTDTLRTGAIRAVGVYLRLEKIYHPDDVNEIVMNVCETACNWVDHLDQIHSENLIPMIVEFLEGVEVDTLSVYRAFNALNNLAKMPGTRAALLAARVPDICSRCPQGPSSDRALSLLCKLFGKCEEGAGTQYISMNLFALKGYLDLLIVVAKQYPRMVNNRMWDPVEMMSDVLQVATADIHKPHLGFVVEKVVQIIENDNSKPQLLSQCVLVLSQLLFEDSLIPEFLEFRYRLERKLGTLVPFDVESGRELVLLRRRLDDLKSDTEDDITEPSASHFPSLPTFAFVYCIQPSATPICEAVVARLQSEGFAASLRTRPLDFEFVNESYAGAIILEPFYFLDFADFSDSSRYAYHERCMQERQCLMESMWDFVTNFAEKMDLVQRVLGKAQAFLIPIDPRGHPRLIKMILFDIAERHSILYPNHPVETIDDAPAHDPETQNSEGVTDTMHADMDNEAALALINEMAGRMVELQGEIQRLSLELVEVRAALPEHGPAEYQGE